MTKEEFENQQREKQLTKGVSADLKWMAFSNFLAGGGGYAIRKELFPYSNDIKLDIAGVIGGVLAYNSSPISEASGLVIPDMVFNPYKVFDDPTVQIPVNIMGTSSYVTVPQDSWDTAQHQMKVSVEVSQGQRVSGINVSDKTVKQYFSVPDTEGGYLYFNPQNGELLTQEQVGVGNLIGHVSMEDVIKMRKDLDEQKARESVYSENDQNYNQREMFSAEGEIYKSDQGTSFTVIQNLDQGASESKIYKNGKVVPHERKRIKVIPTITPGTYWCESIGQLVSEDDPNYILEFSGGD